MPVVELWMAVETREVDIRDSMAEDQGTKGDGGKKDPEYRRHWEETVLFLKQEEDIIMFYSKFLKGSFCLLPLCCSEVSSVVEPGWGKWERSQGRNVCTAAMWVGKRT